MENWQALLVQESPISERCRMGMLGQYVALEYLLRDGADYQ